MRYTADDEELKGASPGAVSAKNTTWDGVLKKPKWDKLPNGQLLFDGFFHYL